MNVKIKTPDGNVIEAEMTSGELREFLAKHNTPPATSNADVARAQTIAEPIAQQHMRERMIENLDDIAHANSVSAPPAQQATVSNAETAPKQKAAKSNKSKPKTTVPASLVYHERQDIITQPSTFIVNAKGKKIPVPPRGTFFCHYCDESFETKNGRKVHEQAHERHPRRKWKVAHGPRKEKTVNDILDRAFSSVQQLTGTTMSPGHIQAFKSLVVEHVQLSPAQSAEMTNAPTDMPTDAVVIQNTPAPQNAPTMLELLNRVVPD